MQAVNAISIDIHTGRMVQGRHVLTQQEKQICYMMNTPENDYIAAKSRAAHAVRRDIMPTKPDDTPDYDRYANPAEDPDADGGDMNEVFEHLIPDDPDDGQDHLRLAHEALTRRLRRRDKSAGAHKALGTFNTVVGVRFVA